MKSNGEPFRRHWREPTTRNRRLVLLLDVSGSMEPYARALLRFVHAAVAEQHKVEAFALGTPLTRVHHPRAVESRPGHRPSSDIDAGHGLERRDASLVTGSGSSTMPGASGAWRGARSSSSSPTDGTAAILPYLPSRWFGSTGSPTGSDGVTWSRSRRAGLRLVRRRAGSRAAARRRVRRAPIPSPRCGSSPGQSAAATPQAVAERQPVRPPDTRRDPETT